MCVFAAVGRWGCSDFGCVPSWHSSPEGGQSVRHQPQTPPCAQKLQVNMQPTYTSTAETMQNHCFEIHSGFTQFPPCLHIKWFKSYLRDKKLVKFYFCVTLNIWPILNALTRHKARLPTRRSAPPPRVPDSRGLKSSSFNLPVYSIRTACGTVE